MTDIKNPTSRRAFLKALGLTASLPLIPHEIFASTSDTQSIAPRTSGSVVRTDSHPIEPSTHRILTCNILLASSAHKGTPFEWGRRKDLCIKIMRDHHPDVICTQEVLGEQNADLIKAFPDFQAFGFAGPEMDVRPGDYQGVTKNVILFSKDRYRLTSAGGFWLSETPNVAGSQSWDSLRARHANWVHLQDRKTGREFRVIDAHLDHKGQKAREEQAKVIMADARQYGPDFCQILAGDFNADMKNPAYKVVIDSGWTDTYTALHGAKDPGFTYHKMEGPAHKSKSGKIDFIFTHGNVKPKASEIIKDNNNGSYPSDHYFLSADVIM